MQFIYGLMTASVLFLCLLFCFYLGTRYEQRKKPPDKIEVDKEEQRKREQLHKDFQELFNYDVSKALQGKKVT